jgi:DNA-binding response OmpR family regulator
MKKILLVEDEAHVVSFIKKGLEEAGFSVTVAFDGRAGHQLFQSSQFDLLILDIMLPVMNGLELCQEIRKVDKQVPILFLTALGTSENIVMGLESGADDYLVKPFKFIELLARLRTLMRRTEKGSHTNEEQDVYRLKLDDLVLNDYTKMVERGGKTISLTTTEYKLLHFFLQNQQRVLSRSDLLDAVWGVNFDMGTNVVDVYVNYLRKKLEQFGGSRLVHTVVGMGYVMKVEKV